MTTAKDDAKSVDEKVAARVAHDQHAEERVAAEHAMTPDTKTRDEYVADAARAEAEASPFGVEPGHDPQLQERNRKDKKLNEAIAASAGSDNIPPHVAADRNLAAWRYEQDEKAAKKK